MGLAYVIINCIFKFKFNKKIFTLYAFDGVRTSADFRPTELKPVALTTRPRTHMCPVIYLD